MRKRKDKQSAKTYLKVLTILITLCGFLLMWGLTTGQPIRQSSEFKAGSEPDGFRGIKWGADISTLKDMALVMTIDNETKRYKRNGDVPKMGEVKLDYIEYEFWKGMLYLVDIGFEGAENWNNLRSRMFATFGKGQNQSEEKEQLSAGYRWEGEKTTIIMIYNASMGGGLTISSTEITNQKAKEEKE
jgi:hypothetical protein